MVLTVAGAYKGDYGHFRKVRLSGYLWPGGSQVWPALFAMMMQRVSGTLARTMSLWWQTNDSLAEWSKALASGASLQGRGFEPHSCHSVNKYTQGSLLTTVTAPMNTCCAWANPWKEYQETSGALGAGYF